MTEYFALIFFHLFFIHFIFAFFIFDNAWPNLIDVAVSTSHKISTFCRLKERLLSGKTNQWSWFELVLGRWSVFCNKTHFQNNLPKPGGVKWTISASDNDNDIVLLLWVNKQVCWIKTAAIRSWAATKEKKKKRKKHVAIETEEVFLHKSSLCNYFKHEENQITLQRGFTYD